MNKITIFAHYDKNNKIEDYVIYYLEGLKKVSKDIVFVSDSNIDDDELKKLNNITIKNIIGSHGEYDFGSYKRGFTYLFENKLLENYDELIFVNDSCYGPLFSLENIWEEMSKKECDFWGITANPNGIGIVDLTKKKFKLTKDYHIQTYFLCLKKQVFQNKKFQEFIENIKKENSKEEIIINYEIGLTKLLHTLDFRSEVYCLISNSLGDSHLKFWQKLIKIDKSPFLKRSLVLHKNLETIYPLFLKSTIKNTSMNYRIIKNDISKNRLKNKPIKKLVSIIKTLREKLY